jgi:ABC-type amino acid transport substrate-binding protein
MKRHLIQAGIVLAGSLALTSAGGTVLQTWPTGPPRQIAVTGFALFAVIPGTTTDQVVRASATQSGAAFQFIAVPDHAEGLAAVERQTADAYASDRIILIGLALAAPNPARFALADQYFSYEPYALMLRRGDPAFRLAVNRALARLYRSSQILDIYTRWFGRLGPPTALMLSLYAIEGLPE